MDPLDRITESSLKFAQASRKAWANGDDEICNEMLSTHVNFLIDELMGFIPKETRKCKVCHCTELHPCPEGCYWVGAELCSSCA